MATEPATETTLQGPAAWEEEAYREHVHGLGPWKLGLRRLRRNKVALLFGFLFILLVAVCVAAPVWADNVAKTGPSTGHLSDTIEVDGEAKNVVGLDGVPIGPQYMKADGKFFLGADGNGRDIMVRLLYGGRNSLFIGLTAALITVLLVDRARRGLGVLPRRRGRRHPHPARHHVVVPGDHPRHGARAWRSRSAA